MFSPASSLSFERENSALVSTTPLYEFFVGDEATGSAEPVPPPAEAGDPPAAETDDAEPQKPAEARATPIKIEYMQEVPAKETEEKE